MILIIVKQTQLFSTGGPKRIIIPAEKKKWKLCEFLQPCINLSINIQFKLLLNTHKSELNDK